MADNRVLTVAFKAVNSLEEIKHLKARGAIDPHKFTGGFRFAGPRWLSTQALFSANETLIFFKSAAPGADIVRAIKSECSVSDDRRYAYLPWKVVPEVFREALTIGEQV